MCSISEASALEGVELEALHLRVEARSSPGTWCSEVLSQFSSDHTSPTRLRSSDEPSVRIGL
eukprot:675040-Prymnesium_polylepis.1